jgi:enoyl-CoA hydratase/carnithine racemase
MTSSLMRGSLVLVERFGDGTRGVKLNRPRKRNALSIELREVLAATFKELAADAACRAVVLSGEGKAFCAGMDFTQFGGDRGNKLKLYHSTRDLFDSVLQFPKPLIAAVHGAAVGGGFTLALCCDERLASEDAYFGFPEVQRGIPAPQDVMRCFVEEVRARDWCETGRRIDVSEALEAGLVKEIVGAGRLLDVSRSEARPGSRRRVVPGLRAALEGEMGRFEEALFPEV